MNGIYEYKYKSTPNGLSDKSLHGAFRRSDTVDFVVIADAESVVMEIHRDSEPERSIVFSRSENGMFTHRIQMSTLCQGRRDGLYWYRYRIRTEDGTTLLLGGEEPRTLQPCATAGDRQLLIYGDCFRTPDNFKGTVIYHIFVDRFKKGGKYPVKDGCETVDWSTDIPEYGERPGDSVKNNTFYGGDLDGITEMLPYIASLGTELLYLSPIFTSPSNHRYDTADYMSVDPMLGGDRALERLCSEAKKHGISVMLDGVFNHTGADSIYFNKYGTYDSVGAYQSKESPYFSWYNFRQFPDDYECWWGVDIMPRVDSENPSWREFILGNNGVIRKYMRLGVNGWRLDVCDELSDTFLDSLYSTVKKENADGIIIGEVWEDATNKISYGKRRHYLRGTQLDSVMNYPFREAVLEYVRYGNCEKFKSITEGIFRRYPEESVHSNMNMLGTHDTVRAITALAGESGEGKCGSELKALRLSETERTQGRKMSIFALGIMCALPGAVSIFYGDETGMEGYRDPFCRRPYPWGGEDTEMISEFARLGNLKKECDALRRGEFEIKTITPDFLEIHRYTDTERVIAYFNRGNTCRISLPEGYRVILGSTVSDGKLSLEQYGTVFFHN